MAKAIRRLKLKSLSEPIVRRPSLKDADIQNILNQRLNEVFKEFGIDGADPDRHRKLCLALLEQVLGIPGFQVLEKRPPRGGRVRRWTIPNQLVLCQFVDELVGRTGCKQVTAFEQAKAKFALKAKADAVGTEYHRAKRLFASRPRLSALIRLIQAPTASGTNAAKFGLPKIAFQGSRSDAMPDEF